MYCVIQIQPLQQIYFDKISALIISISLIFEFIDYHNFDTVIPTQSLFHINLFWQTSSVNEISLIHVCEFMTLHL